MMWLLKNIFSSVFFFRIQSLPVKQHSIEFHTRGTRTEMIEDYEKFYFLYYITPFHCIHHYDILQLFFEER